ncbi:DsbA family protein [Endozoicomonas sp. Mp262]|uniref:DsbA family protein n=1 Tax=Endozoicomonas sp. Mp262 TaxID=2919499 RepID=UPI0021D87C79
MKKILALFILISHSLFLQAATLDQEQQDQVRQLIRQTLMEHPDIIVDAINELRKQEYQKQLKDQKAALELNKKALFEDRNDPYRGAEKPKLTITYFSDFNCGFCKRQDPILDTILEKFPEVRIVYKDLPILGESSREAATLALAAYQQDPKSYVKLHKTMMAKPGRHDSHSIATAFKSENIDIEVLKKMDHKKIGQQLDNNVQLATQLGIQGTPALVFPDHIQGGFTDAEQLEKMIKERLQ